MTWGDDAHLKKLKEEQQQWPADWPDDPKTIKAADKAARKDARKGDAKVAAAQRRQQWPEWPQPAPKAATTPAPSADDIANLKADIWQAKQAEKAHKAAAKAQQQLLKAEQAAAKAARWQADEDRRFQRDMAKAQKDAAKYGGFAPARSEPAYYEPTAAAPRGGGCALPGCSAWVIIIILLLALLLWCGCV